MEGEGYIIIVLWVIFKIIFSEFGDAKISKTVRSGTRAVFLSRQRPYYVEHQRYLGIKNLKKY